MFGDLRLSVVPVFPVAVCVGVQKGVAVSRAATTATVIDSPRCLFAC